MPNIIPFPEQDHRVEYRVHASDGTALSAIFSNPPLDETFSIGYVDLDGIEHVHKSTHREFIEAAYWARDNDTGEIFTR